MPPGGPIEGDAQQVVADYRDQLLRIFRAKHQAPLKLLRSTMTRSLLKPNTRPLFNPWRRTIRRRLPPTQRSRSAKAQLQQLNPESARAELEKLKALKKRHEPQLDGLCSRLATLTATKTRQEAERDAIKADLDRHSGDVVGRYESAINRYLDLFNAGFSIVKVDHNYVGGVNASYHLLINKVAVPLGDEKTPINMPSFKNTLSAGDKSTLALALFLAQLENDPARNERIVVFDDPFSSQDSFRRNQTAIEIVRTIPNVTQVIVLSHDARFLKEMFDKAHDTQIKTLKLNPIGETTEICDLDLAEMLKAGKSGCSSISFSRTTPEAAGSKRARSSRKSDLCLRPIAGTHASRSSKLTTS